MTASGSIRRPARPPRIAVLSVSPAREDHFHLQEILSSPQRTLYPDLAFSVTAKSTVPAAVGVLKHGRTSIVVCENDLSPGAWKELLDCADRLPAPPPIIVTSRLADERMWAEVLNLGGYNVLAKPLDGEEVVRTIAAAWSLWRHQFQGMAAGSLEAGGNAA